MRHPTGRVWPSTRRSAPVNDSPSRSSAALAPAVSPWARLWAASLSAVPAAPSACDAVASSSASCRARSRRCSGVSLVELVAELLQVLARLLRVAVAVRLGLAGGGAREGRGSRTSARPRAARWPGRSGPGGPSRRRRGGRGSRRGRSGGPATGARDRAAPGPAGSVDRSRPRPSRSSSSATRSSLLGLPVCGLPDLRLLGDDRVLRVRDQDHGDQQDRRDERRPRPAGARTAVRTVRAGPSAARPARRGAGAGRTDRSRPPRRQGPGRPSAAPRPRPAPPRPGTPRRAPGRSRHDRPGRPSASTASAVSPSCGRARTPAIEPAEQPDRRGSPRRSAPLSRAGRTGRRSTGQAPPRRPRRAAIQARRASRRTHSRRRWGNNEDPELAGAIGSRGPLEGGRGIGRQRRPRAGGPVVRTAPADPGADRRHQSLPEGRAPRREAASDESAKRTGPTAPGRPRTG